MLLAHTLAFLTVLGLTASVSTSTLAQPALVTVRLGLIPSITAAEAFYAQEMGFFKKHGLDVQAQTMNNGASIAAALAGGSLDIGFADVVSISNAKEHGLPFAYIAPGMINTPSNPFGGLIIRGDSGIVDAKTLNGKTVAVNAVNTASTVSVQAWLDNNGGDSKTLKFIELPLPQMAAAIDQGTVAGGYAGEPFFTMATSHGMKLLVFAKGAVAPTFMGSGWFADTTWIAKNRETATQFAAAMHDAAVWANANRAATEPILTSALKLPADIVHTLNLKPYYGETLRASEIQPVIDAAVKYGALPKPLRADDLIASLK